MNIYRAISIQITISAHLKEKKDFEAAHAIQLGIEALKHHKKLRDAHPYSNYKILPGETTD